jgi:hypothetical protein
MRTVRAHIIVLNLNPYIVYVYTGCSKVALHLLECS